MIITLMLLISHFVGEYILQPAVLVKKKHENIGFLVLHAAIYCALSFAVFFMFGKVWEYIVYSIIVLLTHFGIDWLKNYLNKKYNNRHLKFWSYIVDQVVHIVILISFGLLIGSQFNDMGNKLIFEPYNKIISWDMAYFLRVILCVIIALTPTAVFVRFVFEYIYKNNNIPKLSDGEEPTKSTTPENKYDNNTGALIGILERLVILVLGLMGLYASIAIVLTAKSIARFKQLEDKVFAEKYLIGTLISVLIALLCLLFIGQ